MKPSLFAILALTLSAAVHAQTMEVRVTADNQARLDLLNALGLDIATCTCAGSHPGEVPVFVRDAGEWAALVQNGFQPVVIHPDAETFYTSRLTFFGDTTGAPVFAQGSMGGYFTYAETIAFLDALQAQYPNLMAPKVSLGLTLENREIWMWKISDNPLIDENEPEVLVDALHHCRELGTVMTACWLAKQLCEGYGTDAERTAIVDRRELFLVPIVNPDGLVWNQTTNPAGGGLWRKNRRANVGGTIGVDLNRNYGYQWGYDNTGSSNSGSSETYRGAAAFSEPETAALRDFVNGRSIQLGFSMHSYGRMVFIPYGYITNTFAPPPFDGYYAGFGADLATLPPAYSVGTVWQLLYTANGITTDWWTGAAYGGLTMWGFGAELGSSTDGFWPPTNRIQPIAEEGYAYCKHLLRIAGADPRAVSISVTDIGGQTSGVWEPGETLQVVVTAANKGTLADAVSLSATSTSPWLQVPAGSIGLGTLAFAGGTGSNAGNPLLLTISPAAPPGTTIAFDVVLGAPSAIGSRTAFSATLNAQTQVVADDTFETNQGWTVGFTGDNATAGIWTRQDPIGTVNGAQPFNPENDHTPALGVNCWFTGQGTVGGAVGAQDVDGITTLVSPIFDLAHVQDPVISYWRWFATSTNDTLEVGISNDGGGTWRTMSTLNTTANSWTQVSQAVEAILPRTSAMRLYFRAADNPNDSLCEAAIDDFRIEGGAPAFDLAAAGAPAPGSTTLINLAGPAFPNRAYLLGASLSAQTGITFPGAPLIPLDLDPLLLAVPNLPSIFAGFSGTLNNQGQAQASLILPNDPGLSGVAAFFAGVVIDAGTIPAVSGAVRLVVN